MKKTIVFMAFVLFSVCTAFAQDSTQRTSTQHRTTAHKKSMHNNNSAMSADSVSEGKITTNPNGKMGSKSSVTKRKTRSTSAGSAADSTK